MKNLIALIGRLAFALPFGMFGLMHFMNAEAMAQMVPIPGKIFWVYFTGAGLVTASVTIIIKKWAVLSSFLLALMLLIFILLIWIPGLGNEETMQMAMSNLLKDTSLMGGALTYVAIFMKEREEKLNS